MPFAGIMSFSIIVVFISAVKIYVANLLHNSYGKVLHCLIYPLALRGHCVLKDSRIKMLMTSEWLVDISK